MSKNFTTSDDFKPTPAMRVWVDAAIETMSDNISEIAKVCKVSRQSWYGWVKDRNFVNWYNNEWNVRLKANLWQLDAIGFRKAKLEFKFWEAMQKKLGGYDRYKLRIDSDPITFRWKTEEFEQDCEENDS